MRPLPIGNRRLCPQKNNHPTTPVLNKGDTIASRRTGKTMRCYHIMPVCMGDSGTVVRFEYSFVLPDGRFRTIKGSRLSEMLSGVWTVRPFGDPA